MTRLKRNYVPKRMYLIEHGAEMMIYRSLSAVFRVYKEVCGDLNGQYREKVCRKALNDWGFWVNKEGWVRIRAVKQMDYLPSKRDKLYNESLPEGYVKPMKWSNMNEEQKDKWRNRNKNR